MPRVKIRKTSELAGGVALILLGSAIAIACWMGGERSGALISLALVAFGAVAFAVGLRNEYIEYTDTRLIVQLRSRFEWAMSEIDSLKVVVEDEPDLDGARLTVVLKSGQEVRLAHRSGLGEPLAMACRQSGIPVQRYRRQMGQEERDDR